MLISIIIPVYNVSAYIKKCLDSVINQSYKNLEIIIIDDSSSDSSYEICQEYEKLDNRIFLHKNQENMGLSATRNLGINRSQGLYLFFVDSDDWIHEKAIEYLYENIIKYNAQISVGNIAKVYSYEDKVKTKKHKIKAFEKERALEILYKNKYFYSHAVCKLIKKTLFNNIDFELNRIYEDQITIPKIINNAENTVYDNRVLYYYLQRNDSIVNNSFSPKKLDYLYAFDSNLEYFKQANTKFLKLIKHKWILAFHHVYKSAYLSNRIDELSPDLYEKYKKFSKGIVFNIHISTKNKIEHLIFKTSKKAYFFLIDIFYRKST